MTSLVTSDSPQVEEEVPPPLAGLRRWAMVSAGLVLIGLGVLGAILPGLPSTVFVLGASYCFARSSPRLHHWLLHHPRLGPPLRNWHRHRAMSVRAKATALVLMWIGVWISSMALPGKGALIVVGLALVGTMVVLFGVRTLTTRTQPGEMAGPAAEACLEARKATSQRKVLVARSDRLLPQAASPDDS